MEPICAIATAPGGAIGIVRISGDGAITAAESVFRPQSPTPLHKRQPYTLTFGHIIDPSDGEIVDEVLVSLFRAPHSYTGEDAVEISCHGSAYILSRTIELLIAAGCRMARPGEYTQRAFLNGRMDLSQAEAVADLIASSTRAGHHIAMQQMRGGFSHELQELRSQLLHLTSLLELELDFSDHEDLEFADRGELSSLARTVHNHLASLCQSFRLGNALKTGVPIAIVGETNAGKSTLLNALVGEERALVSDIHGTTRDTIEEHLTLGGTPLRLIDTAGLRHTTDRIEQMGIERSIQKIDEAEIVIWMIDPAGLGSQINGPESQPVGPAKSLNGPAASLNDPATHLKELASHILPATAGKQLIAVINKADTVTPSVLARAESLLATALPPEAITLPPLSVKTTQGVSQIKEALSRALARFTAGTPSGADTPSVAPTTPTTTATTPSAICTTPSAIGTTPSATAPTPSAIGTPSVPHTPSAATTLVSNLRHYEALRAALTAIDRASAALSAGLSGDLVSQDLRECLHHLSDILGEVTTDEVLGNIFSHFCVGK